MIDQMNAIKPFYQGDLCGYFAKILKKDPEETHLFALTAKN